MLNRKVELRYYFLIGISNLAKFLMRNFYALGNYCIKCENQLLSIVAYKTGDVFCRLNARITLYMFDLYYIKGTQEL